MKPFTVFALAPPAHSSIHTHIRVAAATEACLGLLPKLNLVEQVVGMLNDQVPEIRRNVIANGVAKISEKLTGDQFSENVLTHLKKCVDDKQWLVRAAFIEQIPTITKKMVRLESCMRQLRRS